MSLVALGESLWDAGNKQWLRQQSVASEFPVLGKVKGCSSDAIHHLTKGLGLLKKLALPNCGRSRRRAVLEETE